MTDAPTPQLRECPFCGGKPFIDMDETQFGAGLIACDNKKCLGPILGFDSLEIAVELWNTRSPSPLRELRGWLDIQIEAYYADYRNEKFSVDVRLYAETKAECFRRVRQWLAEREGGGGNG